VHVSNRDAWFLATRPFRAGRAAAILPDMVGELEIVGGPTPIHVLRVPGTIYRWKVHNGTAEQHVYVQIADTLHAEHAQEPLRSAIESKGESVLRKLLAHRSVPVRIKITSVGVTEVGVDRRSRPVPL